MSPLELPFLKRKKDLSEIEEDNERLEAENRNEELQLSIAQKEKLRKELKSRGLSTSNFGGSLSRAWTWMKTH
jgi:hypothetical protein